MNKQVKESAMTDARAALSRSAILAAWLAVQCALLLVAAGCASNPPQFPDLGESTASRPATNALAAAATADTNAAPAPAAASPAPPAETNSMADLDDKRELSIGDRLSFNILEDNEEPKVLVVADSGDLEVPLLGRRSVTGVTCKKLAYDLKKDLEAKYYYHATVIISVDSMSRTLGRVYASGALRAPGPLEIPGDEVFTLSKAILRAGGFTDFADTHSVKVTRKSVSGGPNQTFKVDVGKILQDGRTDLDLTLQAGDMVYVGERVIRF